MLTRRSFVRTSAAGLAAGIMIDRAWAAAEGEPVAIVRAIYVRAAKANGGNFHQKAVRAKYLSTELAALWDKAEAKTANDGPGPVEFDPVSNSQDPDIKSYTLATETQDSGRVVVATTIAGHHDQRAHDADSVVRYDFVRENSHWRIDDIRGAVDGVPWSVREILNDALKN